MTSQPYWYNEDEVSTWTTIKEALKRDWEQTKHDLHLGGGHELNQDAGDTLKQAAQIDPLPPPDKPNPPRVIGHWDEAEYPIGYGYSARRTHGVEHPTWNEGIEQRLRTEWEARNDRPNSGWGDVKGLIRYGYEYKPKS